MYKVLNRNILLILVVLFSAVLIYTSQLRVEAAKVPEITKEELREKLEKKADVIVVDVRKKESYDKSHIIGAISIPLEEIEQRHEELPKDKEIILYCH
jgi:predicted sulfurtransferase